MSIQKQLRQTIEDMLDKINGEQLPYLMEKISTEAGRQTSADAIFDLAVSNRISLQTAMSIYDTQLSEIIP